MAHEWSYEIGQVDTCIVQTFYSHVQSLKIVRSSSKFKSEIDQKGEINITEKVCQKNKNQSTNSTFVTYFIFYSQSIFCTCTLTLTPSFSSAKRLIAALYSASSEAYGW